MTTILTDQEDLVTVIRSPDYSNSNNNNNNNNSNTASIMAPISLDDIDQLQNSPTQPELSTPVNNESLPINNNKYLDKDSELNTYIGLRKIVIGGFIFSLTITIALIIQISIGPSQLPSRIGIVTPEQVCSNIGGDMIKEGGNSIDAYIASSLCLAVVNPFAAGFGAGGFLVIRDHKHEKHVAVNCFFQSGSKLAIEQDYQTRPDVGVKSIAIPGELKCLQFAYHKYSKFYWHKLIQPAINLAENGFNVSKLLAENLKKLNKSVIESNEYLKQMYLDKEGNLVKENDVIKNPYLAKAIESLERNENSLYMMDTDLSDDLLKTSDYAFTHDDLKNYTIHNNELVLANYKDFVLVTTPYPSSGPIFKFILELMAQLNFDKDNILKNVDFYHRLLEAVRVGYIVQSNIADPELSKLSLNELKGNLSLINDDFVKSTDDNKLIDVSDKIKEYSINDDLYVNYITVNDHNDLMVSYVGTLGSAWGSQVFTENGYMLNDGLNLFSYKDDPIYNKHNAIGVSKQPRGLMAPIVTYNRKNLCMRRFIISYAHKEIDDYGLSSLLQVIVKLFTDLSFYPSAIDDKRIEYDTDGICFEDGFDEAVKTQIIQMNNQHYIFNNTQSTCSYEPINVVMKKDHIIYTKSDKNRGSSSDNDLVFDL